MTSLRDPRFEKALEVAPDAHLRPDARTRQAVLEAAAAAVQTQSAHQPVAWWRRLWSGGPGGGAGRMPWNAAFATVLLAGFVTLLWQGQPVPDAQPDDAPASKAMRQTAPSAAKPTQAPVAGGDMVPSTAPSAAPSPKSVPQPPPQASPAPPVAPAARPAPSAKAAADADARVESSQSAPRREPVPEPAPDPAPAPAPANAQERSNEAAPTSAAQRSDAAAAPAESSARAQASAAPSAPARAAAPGLAAGSALGRAAPVAMPDSAAVQGWTELRITQGGQTRRIARADATALAAQVRRLAPTSGEGAMPGAPSLRIAFAQGNEVLAEFELGEPPWVRWTLLRAGFAGQWAAQADRGQLQMLQLELQRLGFTPR